MSTSYRLRPLPPEVAREVRASLLAPGYEHPAHVSTATGYGPCRVCLRKTVTGEERVILFTYDPFAGREPFPLPSPVYVHEHDCDPYAHDERFPEELRDVDVTLNAYAPGRILRAQERVAGADADDALAALFERDDVDYVHVRNTRAGCFIVEAVRRPAGT
ncbi:MAG TPA: DUF1203 domain-containing protein [Actinomycetota bacterium]|nr:DUF1203 domain-containing protein [Actinomycetota bacterium]